jgi:hypothetical protein
MTVTFAETRAWLDAQRPPPPGALAARMREALSAPGEDAGGTLAERLGEAALACLRAALESVHNRDGALDLLAADALLTYASAAAAEEGSEALDRFMAVYGSARLAVLLEEPAGG